MATGVRLIEDEERLRITGQIDGADWWIDYKRVPAHIRSHIQQKHTKRGDKTDWQAVTIDLAKAAHLAVGRGLVCVRSIGVRHGSVDLHKGGGRSRRDLTENDVLGGAGGGVSKLNA